MQIIGAFFEFGRLCTFFSIKVQLLMWQSLCSLWLGKQKTIRNNENNEKVEETRGNAILKR